MATPFYAIARQIYNRDRANNLLRLAFLAGTQGTMERNSDNAVQAVVHFAEEIKLYEEAGRTGMIEAHSLKLAGAYEHMAVGTQQRGDYAGPAIWHTRNIDILQKYHPNDLDDIAMAYVNKSWSLWRTGKLEEASQMLTEVLSYTQTSLGRNPKDFQALRAYVIIIDMLLTRCANKNSCKLYG